MPELLKKYQTMRDFSDTPEPSGKEKRPRKKTLMFVNNRLEGNALNTITAMIEGVDD